MLGDFSTLVPQSSCSMTMSSSSHPPHSGSNGLSRISGGIQAQCNPSIVLQELSPALTNANVGVSTQGGTMDANLASQGGIQAQGRFTAGLQAPVVSTMSQSHSRADNSLSATSIASPAVQVQSAMGSCQHTMTASNTTSQSQSTGASSNSLTTMSAIPNQSQSATNNVHGGGNSPSPGRNNNLAITSRKEWTHPSLRWPMVTVVIIFQVGLISTLIGLLQWSKQRIGFVDVPVVPTQTDGNDARNFANISLCWQTVPVLIFTLYGGLWKSLVDNFTKRQPFVDLNRRGGDTLRRTMISKYESSWIVPAIWEMCRNRHGTLAICNFLLLLTSIFLIPFAAYIFQSAPVAVLASISVSVDSGFDTARLTSTIDFRTILQDVTASLVNRAPYPSWTSMNESIPRLSTFQDLSQPSANGSSPIYSANVQAFTANLSCQYMIDKALNVSRIADSIPLSFIDRGCNVSKTIEVTGEKAISIQGFTRSGCSSESGYSRIALLMSRIDTSTSVVINNVLISCIPRYFYQRGDVSVMPINNSITFSPTQGQSRLIDLRASWLNMDNKLFQSSVFQPSGNIAASDFTETIYLYAISQSNRTRGDYIEGPELLKSTEQSFRTFCAFLGTRVLAGSYSGSATIEGKLSTTVQRLFVVAPIVYPMVVVLGISAICACVVRLYTQKTQSGQYEEQVGLLGAANVLRDNNAANRFFDVIDGQNNSNMAESLPRRARHATALSANTPWSRSWSMRNGSIYHP